AAGASVTITTAPATPCNVPIVARGRRATPHGLRGPSTRAAAGAPGHVTRTEIRPGLVPAPVPVADAPAAGPASPAAAHARRALHPVSFGAPSRVPDPQPAAPTPTTPATIVVATVRAIIAPATPALPPPRGGRRPPDHSRRRRGSPHRRARSAAPA